MPLEHSSSSQAFKKNVRTLMGDVGKSPHIQTRAQALKIAYETQRRARAGGGGVPRYDIGGAVDPLQQPQPAPGVMPPPLPGNTGAPPAPAGVAGPMPPPDGAPPAPGMPTPPQAQWASGVAQNAAPPAQPQNAPLAPPAVAPLGAAPQPVPASKPLMANGGALSRAGGGFNMAKAPNLAPAWHTRSQDRQLHIGPVLSSVPGRTDSHRVKVPSGSYVLPAAHISSMGDGNTLSGLAKAGKMFGGPYGTSAGSIRRGPGAPRPPRGLADGGEPPQQDYGQPVDVDISGGEYVIPPEAIIHRYGDLDIGHKILDRWVMAARKVERKILKDLPPPAKA